MKLSTHSRLVRAYNWLGNVLSMVALFLFFYLIRVLWDRIFLLAPVIAALIVGVICIPVWSLIMRLDRLLTKAYENAQSD